MLNTFEKLPAKKQYDILNAAAKVFAKKGYYQANVAEICKAAGISNGALYKYFKNKEDLFQSVLSSHIDRLADVLNIRNTAGVPFFTLMEDLLNGMVLFTETELDYWTIYHDLGSASMDHLTATLSTRIERVAHDFWVEMLKKGKLEGDIRADIDTDVAAYAVDNHIMIFIFSFISRHYQQRFQVYFGGSGKELSGAEKVEYMMRSIKQLLG